VNEDYTSFFATQLFMSGNGEAVIVVLFAREKFPHPSMQGKWRPRAMNSSVLDFEKGEKEV